MSKCLEEPGKDISDLKPGGGLMAIEILILVRSCLSRCLSFFLSVMQTLCLLPQFIYIC